MEFASLIAEHRERVESLGLSQLTTPEDVDAALKEGTVLVFVNSMCGCAQASAHPGLAEALKHEKRPDRLTTVFAGQDHDATTRAREYFAPHPPSSPCFALLKDGSVVEMISRDEIRGHAPHDVAERLVAAFEAHC